MVEKVGILFFSNGKLLLKKENNQYGIINSEVNFKENILQTITRAIHQAFGNKMVIEQTKLEYLFGFEEGTTHFNIFKYNGLLTGETSANMEDFMWYGVESDYNVLSDTLKKEIIPYCLNSGLIKIIDFNQIKNQRLTAKEKYIKSITELNVKLKVKKGVYNELI